MKLIEAVIRPLNLEEVETALKDMGVEEIGAEEIMVSQPVSNGSKTKGASFYRGVEYVANVMTKMKVEIIVADGLVDKVVETIRQIARTDRKEDCRIFIHPVVEAL
jgi:nitrogen regulatory protein P-II 1